MRFTVVDDDTTRTTGEAEVCTVVDDEFNIDDEFTTNSIISLLRMMGNEWFRHKSYERIQ